MSLEKFSDDAIRAEFARRFPTKKSKQKWPDVGEKVPCTTPYQGTPPKTQAQASRIRRERMEQCGCALCYDALRPVTTFAEQALRTGRPYPPHNPLDEILEKVA